MVCNLLDFRCIFVNELIGSVAISLIFLAALWFVFASKMKIGFRAIIAISVPLLLISSTAISSITVPYVFLTIIAGILIGTLFSKIMEGK